VHVRRGAIRHMYTRVKKIDGRMPKIDNLFKCFVVAVSKALKIYSLLFSCSVATVHRTKGGQPSAVYPSFWF
jgi:hypothetical protein